MLEFALLKNNFIRSLKIKLALNRIASAYFRDRYQMHANYDKLCNATRTIKHRHDYYQAQHTHPIDLRKMSRPFCVCCACCRRVSRILQNPSVSFSHFCIQNVARLRVTLKNYETTSPVRLWTLKQYHAIWHRVPWPSRAFWDPAPTSHATPR